MHIQGVVAGGHPETAKTAETILLEGGNAFDAVVAAHLAACVVEPVLSSLGGGGFLLARTADGYERLYDFFVQTPSSKRTAGDTDFYPISADFGPACQEFHIGLGSVATPGTVKGLFAVHRELCSLPMTFLAEPALELARCGVVMNAFQAYIFDVVQAIYLSDAEARKVYCGGDNTQRLLREGERLRQPQLADAIDVLSREGEALFYRGEIAKDIARLCREQGGHLTLGDFAGYRVAVRKPLSVGYREAVLLTNPPPSSGGILIAFALKLLETMEVHRFTTGSTEYLNLLAQVQAMTNQARIDALTDEMSHHPGEHLLDPNYIAFYCDQIKGKPVCSRGTTHISIIDGAGNIASLTTSNGEGCGRFAPGTGIMLNNMLGEEDLNPRGFHAWNLNQRMTSMMAPCIAALPDGRQIALGSGGSNRLRTAILQVLLNLIDFGMPLDEAVNAPRLHCEGGLLSVEGGFHPDELKSLLKDYPNHKLWDGKNLFFGGTHSALMGNGQFAGVGDPRRGGCAAVV
ncbi:MAG: gamma-glutamyltransferase [Gammaproteobacteria bacterium]